MLLCMCGTPSIRIMLLLCVCLCECVNDLIHQDQCVVVYVWYTIHQDHDATVCVSV